MLRVAQSHSLRTESTKELLLQILQVDCTPQLMFGSKQEVLRLCLIEVLQVKYH